MDAPNNPRQPIAISTERPGRGVLRIWRREEVPTPRGVHGFVRSESGQPSGKGVALRLIEPGKRNQSAYVEPFNPVGEITNKFHKSLMKKGGVSRANLNGTRGQCELSDERSPCS